jgi:DNA-binding MarR family transcriptional regulator
MDRIEDCISFLVGKAAQQVTRRAREKLAVYGVTPVQYAVLKVLWDEDGQSGSELGSRLVLDSATVTGVVDRLEASGHLERRSDKDDRRIHRLFLTSKGKGLSGPLDVAMNELNAEAEKASGKVASGLKPALRLLSDPENWD